MANKDDYLTYYREFFENFAQTVNPNDQLPVKLASYKLVNYEVVGGIIDWTTQYLAQKKCPLNLVAPLVKIIIEEIRKACKKQPLSCGFVPADNAYEPLKLMQTVMAKTNEVCLRYLDNSMLCSLPSPGTPFFVTSVCALKNSRRRMEDRHVVIHDLNTMFNIQEASPSSYYAVFDGHAGRDAAVYSSAHLHQFLAENIYFVSNPVQALLDAFCKTDALFIDKCKVENLSSGTTAVVALLRPKENTLYVAWVGDSQALLVNRGRVLQIVNPHKPSRQDERERIEKQGGCVMMWGTWRVNGQLAVSRAIGDAEYKPHVIAIPDVREIPLDGGEDFLILACDGLWDFLSEDCAASTVYRLVTQNPDDTDRIAQHLVLLAKEQGSTDNISVIVVFLREPSKIAAEAHWANRNCTPTTMEAGLDNANNPFAIPNGAPTDNIISQKSEGLLLNLTDNFKQNGTDLSPNADFYGKEKSNGKRSASEFEDDDFGPETDVDTVEDVLSPVETAKGFGDVFSNNNPLEGVTNPFVEYQEKAALETEHDLQKQQSDDFDDQRLAREETPTPPADTVNDVSGLVENAAESESEDEWNYYKGDEANKENISPQPNKEVAEIPEEDDNMSQLNPNAAEFVPVSPTRSIPSPACRTLINDPVISQSPVRPVSDIDINLPNQAEFEQEVKSRPSDIDSYDSSDNHNVTTDLMENLLNGKNIDEIPEFQPGSTPRKVTPSEEFHFGPNAAPFTPAKLLDQSEAALSTKAVYGDESTATLGTSFNESVTSQDTVADLNILNKESDPMSMSFYADKGESNPFDLNTVQMIPDNLDEFLEQCDNTALNETAKDVPDHEKSHVTLNNDEAIQITDLDKQAYDDEKELASPVDLEKDLFESEKDIPPEDEGRPTSKTPEPTHENLLDFCHISEKSKISESETLPRDVELISPELHDKQSELSSSRPDSSNGNLSESKSPYPEATEVDDLLQAGPESLPRDVELISPQPMGELSASPKPEEMQIEATETADVIQSESKSPLPIAMEVSDLLEKESDIRELKTGIFNVDETSLEPEPHVSDSDILESKSPLPETTKFVDLQVETDVSESKSPLPEELEDLICQRPKAESQIDLPQSESPVCGLPESKSPVCDLPASASPVFDLPESASPVCDLPECKSPVCDLPESKTPTSDLLQSKSPVCDLPESKSPVNDRPDIEMLVCELPTSKSPIFERPIEAPVCELPLAKSPVCELPEAKSPVCELPVAESPVCELEGAISPVCDLTEPKLLDNDLLESKSPVPENVLPVPLQENYDYTPPEVITEAEKHFFEELCKPSENTSTVESPIDEVVTSSLKDEDVTSPARSPIADAEIEDSFLHDQTTLVVDFVQSVVGAVQETVVELLSSPPTEELVPDTCPVSPPKSIADTESVATTDVNSFLDRSLLPDVASPLNTTEQESEPVIPASYVINEQISDQAIHNTLDLTHSISKCDYQLPTLKGEQIDVKTENITPEFAEQLIVVTPSEESKQEDVPTAPLLEEPVQELSVEKEKIEKKIESIPAAVPCVTKTDEKKKSSAPTARKSTTPKGTTAKPTTTTTRATTASKTPSRLTTSPRAPPKTGTLRPQATAPPKPAPTKPLAKPKTTSTTAKPTDKKPLTNGDIKSTVKSTLMARKSTESATSKTATTTSRSASAKLSPTKTSSPRPAPAAPRPASVPKSTTTRLAATTSSTTAPKPRPTTLTKTTPNAVPKTSTITKSTVTKTSPKTALAPKPKPPTSTFTVTATKPRAPLTKTVNKAPDTEKQIKESANKLTASKSTTRTANTSTVRTTSSTVRKVESKTTAARTTLSKTTTTTMKSTTGKKPAEIVRNIHSKTKTTKIEKPKENGISTVVTEEIAIVKTSSVIDSEPQLVKDNSPVDNKLLIENSLVETNIAD